MDRIERGLASSTPQDKEAIAKIKATERWGIAWNALSALNILGSGNAAVFHGMLELT